MAPFPPSGNDNDTEADHESNDPSKSAPQSSQEPGDTDGGDKTAMLMEPRLMLAMSWDEVADSRQTLRDSSSSTFQTTTQPTTSHSASPVASLPTPGGGTSKINHHHHVASNTAAQQNDITINSTSEALTATEQNTLRPEDASSTSLLPSTSFTLFGNQATSSTTQAMHATPPLSQELVQASNEAAVSSVAEIKQAPQLEEAELLKVEAKQHEEDDAMSAGKLVAIKKSRSRKRSPQVKAGQSNGRWTHEEHQSFLEGLKVCGREWKKVASRIPTRTSAQIRSHAQKYFSKLQRDVMPPDGHASCCGAAAIPSEAGASLLPSVQQNVERIIANPQAVQREVEDTLEALRERYRQLQRRLEQQQQRRHHRNTGRVIEEDNSPHSHHSDRKRALDEESKSHDAQTSVSSNFSASLASLPSSVAGARELGNEELIALQVLGGSLPRGGSSLENESIRGAARERPRRWRHSSDTSLASSSTSLPSDDEDDSTDKRQRKEG
jgi:SHAQKYF class myb-like DNA-binding protein